VILEVDPALPRSVLCMARRSVNSEFRRSSVRCNTRCLDLSFAKTLAHSPTALEMLNVCLEEKL